MFPLTNRRWLSNILLQKGDNRMSDNEKKLLSIIREHDNPEFAIEVAINLLLDFLNELGEPQGTSLEHPRESA